MEPCCYKIFVLMAVTFSFAFNFVYVKDLNNADFTWEFSVSQTFESISHIGTKYEILTPNLTKIMSPNGEHTEFSLNKSGDVYILAHLPDGSENVLKEVLLL